MRIKPSKRTPQTSHQARTGRTLRPLMEALESRQLLSASTFVLGADTHQLTVTGTSRNDHISVSLKGNKLVAKMDGKAKRFAAASVQSLAVNAGAGNDVVTVGSTVSVPATLDGGSGNNVLQGGSGTNNFVPAGGTDAVVGFHPGDVGEDSSNGQAGRAGTGGVYCGSVASVGTDTLTLNTFAQSSAVKTKTFNVSSSTTITLDGQPAALADLGNLTAGAHVVVQVSPTDKTAAVSISAVGPHVQGTVASVDTAAGTITLQGVNGAAGLTYTLSPTAAIKLNGNAAAISDLTADTHVELWQSAASGGTVVAIDAGDVSEPAPGGPGGPGDNGGPGSPGGDHGGAAIGSVVGVDTSANTITLSTLTPTGTAQQTFSVTSGTAITVDGTTATLADLGKLASSARVIVQAAPGSTTADAISAVGPHVEGTVVSVDTTADTLTVQGGNNSTSQTYTLGANAVVTVDGAVSSLSALTAGTEVHIRLSASDGTTAIGVLADTAEGQGGAGATGAPIGAPTPGGPEDNGGADGGAGGSIGDPHGPPVQVGAVGTVVSVDASAGTITLSVLSEAGTTRQETFAVASSTTITVDGKSATLASLSGLSSSARVCVQVAPASTSSSGTTNSTPTASAIIAVGPHAGGQVTAVDASANTITVQGPNGQAAQTFTVGSGATITVDGSTGSLSGVTVGSNVQIQLSAVDGTTVVALNAFTGGNNGGPGKGGPGGGGTGDGGPNGGPVPIPAPAPTPGGTVGSPGPVGTGGGDTGSTGSGTAGTGSAGPGTSTGGQGGDNGGQGGSEGPLPPIGAPPPTGTQPPPTGTQLPPPPSGTQQPPPPPMVAPVPVGTTTSPAGPTGAPGGPGPMSGSQG